MYFSVMINSELSALTVCLPSRRSSIVAVHGLNGDAHSTWTSDKGNICWLNHVDLLPKYLPNARILTWGYNANVISLKGRSTSSDRVLQHAQTLVAQLQADREVCGWFFPFLRFKKAQMLRGGGGWGVPFVTLDWVAGSRR